MDRTSFAYDLEKNMPYAAALGMVVDEATPEKVTAHLDWSPQICTGGGTLHGGAYMTFGDSVGAICTVLNLPDGAHTTTVSSSTTLLRGLREGTAYATSIPLSVGRTMITVRTDISNSEGKLLAQVTQSQVVLYPR